MNESITQWLEKYPQSTVEEMRAIRREIINHWIVCGYSLSYLTDKVRGYEVDKFGQELRVY